MRPLLIVSDAPNLKTGLGRIARDLASLLYQHRERLGLDVAQLGWGYDGSPWPWRVYPVMDQDSWAAGDLMQTLAWHDQREQGGAQEPAIVLTIWDPSRCFPITKLLRERRSLVELWGYFPIDSHNWKGAIGGPAQEAVWSYDRVLAYGRFGAGVLEMTLGPRPGADAKEEVPWLPHGLGASWSGVQQAPHQVQHGGKVSAFLATCRPGDVLVGVVAANQPRKDFGLVFETCARMRDKLQQAGEKRGPMLKLWINTDRVVGHSDLGWALPELAQAYGFNHPAALHVTIRQEDDQLADLYRRCAVTLAPGLGEGFGYPIAESLACGTPVIHGGFGGGREIVSEPRWIMRELARRVEGPYALQRPVYDPEEWAAAALEAARWKLEEPQACSAYCAGSVAHLRWDALGERWLEVLAGWLGKGDQR